MASWYGREFHGKRTSSGEVYDMYALTAAHKTLPLPTMARVTSLTTGKSIVVRINDRGPFKKGRLIDLSYGAARELGFLSAGTAMVEVQALTEPDRRRARSIASAAARAHARMYVQVGAFSQRENAEDLKRRLEHRASANVVIRYDARSEPALYRVRVGPVADAAEYDAVVGRVTRLDIGEPRLVVESAGADWARLQPAAGHAGRLSARQDIRVWSVQHEKTAGSHRASRPPRFVHAGRARPCRPSRRRRPSAAKAYVLIDFNTGKVLAAANEHARLEPASLTKLMTAYTVFKALQDGRGQADRRRAASASAPGATAAPAPVAPPRSCRSTAPPRWRSCSRA